MFLIATINDKTNAPRIRRQLKAQDFSYNRARAIDGATIEMRTGEEMHAIINAAIAGA